MQAVKYIVDKIISSFPGLALQHAYFRTIHTSVKKGGGFVDNQTENCPKCPGMLCILSFPKYNVKKGQWTVVDNQFETSCNQLQWCY